MIPFFSELVCIGSQVDFEGTMFLDHQLNEKLILSFKKYFENVTPRAWLLHHFCEVTDSRYQQVSSFVDWFYGYLTSWGKSSCQILTD